MSFLNQDLQATHQILSMFEAAKSAQDRSIDVFPGVFAFVDSQGTVLKANANLTRILNVSSEEALGLSLSRFFREEHWQLFSRNIERSFKEKGLLVTFELPIHLESAAESTEYFYYWHIVNLAGVESREPLTLVIGNDITQLRKTESRMNEFFSEVPIGIMTIGSGALIEPQYSGQCEVLLDHSELPGSDFRAIIQSQVASPLSAMERKAFEDLPGCFDKIDVFFQVVRDMLPKEVVLKNGKTLALAYQGISYSGVIKKVLILIDDRTSLVRVKANEQAQELKEQYLVARVMELKESSPAMLAAVLRDLDDGFSLVTAAIERRDVAGLWAGLHGIKGNARVAGFKVLADLTHSAESEFKETTKTREVSWDEVKTSMASISKEFGELKSLHRAFSEGDDVAKGRREAALEFRGKMVQLNSLDERRTPFAKRSVSKALMRELEHWAGVGISEYQEKVQSIVRRTARELNKRVRVEFDPGEVRVDPPLANALSNSFLHILTNAVCHGIETPEVRTAKKKDEQGLIKVRVLREKHGLICTIDDDGAGFDLDRIRNKAIATGLLDEKSALKMSEDEIIHLIFHSGFSTSGEVTHIAGRGVGLDAVVSQLADFSGTVRAQNKPEGGARFVIRVPEKKRAREVKHHYALEELRDAVVDGICELSISAPEQFQIDYRHLDMSDWSGVVRINLSKSVSKVLAQIVEFSGDQAVKIKLSRLELSLVVELEKSQGGEISAIPFEFLLSVISSPAGMPEIPIKWGKITAKYRLTVESVAAELQLRIKFSSEITVSEEGPASVLQIAAALPSRVIKRSFLLFLDQWRQRNGV